MNQTEKDLVAELKRRIANLSDSPFKKQRNLYKLFIIELTNFILYHKEHAQILLPIWYTEIITLPQMQKLYMFQSMSEVLYQTHYKTDIFVKDFAHNLHINFPMIIQNITDNNVYKILEDLINSWEEREIYRNDFKEYLIKCLNNQRFSGNSAMQIDDISMNRKPVYLNEDKVKEDLKLITNNKISSEILALQFQEKNIADYYNSNISSHELERYLKEHPRMNDEVSFTVNQCEKICKDFRAYVMRGLIRRECVIRALAIKAKMMRDEYMEAENNKEQK